VKRQTSVVSWGGCNSRCLIYRAPGTWWAATNWRL